MYINDLGIVLTCCIYIRYIAECYHKQKIVPVIYYTMLCYIYIYIYLYIYIYDRHIYIHLQTQDNYIYYIYICIYIYVYIYIYINKYACVKVYIIYNHGL